MEFAKRKVCVLRWCPVVTEMCFNALEKFAGRTWAFVSILFKSSFPTSFHLFVLLLGCKLELETQYRQWPEARKAHATNWNPDHPGCMLVGFLLVNRVPGNFHIEVCTVARSSSV
jgi:hypothetical protein